ncbi:hypothetical protein B6D51_01010 [Pseudomonas chlororaphis subsp. chlororaphis]|nr:hypothetical protein B6D51_01010 [Pseudomonas chlororaphis subsp. chlororaphis]
MPSFGHAEPRRGTEWWGKALWLLWGLSKVTRRKGGTLSGRYRRNGYVHRSKKRCQGRRYREQASLLQKPTTYGCRCAGKLHCIAYRRRMSP